MGHTEGTQWVMSETKAKSNRGRKPIQIDVTILDELCSIMCTLREISGVFHCSEDTIERFVKKNFGLNFAEYFRIKSADKRASLRRRQFQVALDEERPSIPMLQFLGKNYLGQSDNPDPIDEKEVDFQPLPSLIDDRNV